MARTRKPGRRKAKPKPSKKPRPRGRPSVFSPAILREILAVLAAGCSRNDAADVTGIGRSTLSEQIAKNEAFSEQVKKAEAAGKLRHIRKINKSKAWQASAWFLERKYPEEYARKVPLPVVAEDNGPRRFTFEVSAAPEHREPQTDGPHDPDPALAE